MAKENDDVDLQRFGDDSLDYMTIDDNPPEMRDEPEPEKSEK